MFSVYFKLFSPRYPLSRLSLIFNVLIIILLFTMITMHNLKPDFIFDISGEYFCFSFTGNDDSRNTAKLFY